MKTVIVFVSALLAFFVSVEAATLDHHSQQVIDPNSVVLKQGSRGGRVVLLQDFLEARGFERFCKGVKKGYYGRVTKLSVMEFQEAVHLPETGIADEATFDAINHSTCSAEKPSIRKIVTKAAIGMFGCKAKVVAILTGKATTFGGHDRKDNGLGSMLLNPQGLAYINTRNPNLMGVALPKSYLQQILRIPDTKWRSWAEARMAGVQIEMNGVVSPVVHIEDLGPGTQALRRGVVVDRLRALASLTGEDGPCKVLIYKDYFAFR